MRKKNEHKPGFKDYKKGPILKDSSTNGTLYSKHAGQTMRKTSKHGRGFKDYKRDPALKNSLKGELLSSKNTGQTMNEKRNEYWLSLEDYKNDPALKDSLKNEFLSSLPSEGEMSASRREFLQIMGAGLALTSTGCLRRPAEKLVPYINRPADIVPGEANYYASSYYDGGEGFSTLIKTREGRPIKIEGNEEAELLNGSALSPRAHAYILSLYDPERAKGPKQNLFNREKSNKETIGISFQELDETLAKEFQKGKTALLTNRIPSPSTQRLIKTFRSVFNVEHYVWSAISLEDLTVGQKISYGQALAPSYNISKARFIFSLNCDFLGTYLSPTEFQKQFAKTRKPDHSMSRLVVLESLMSLTGSNADERHRLKLQDQMTALMALTKALIQKRAFSPPAQLTAVLKSYEKALSDLKIPKSKWEEWAGELIRHKGRGLILFGGLRSQTKDSVEIHTLVNFLNSALGHDGQTVNHTQFYPYDFGSYSQMDRLISDLNKGLVTNVIIHGVNPVYSYAGGPELIQALKKAKLVVYTGDRMDETGSYADYLVPDSHPLEKWADWEFKKGVFTIQQPAIRPLYNSRAFEDSLIAWIKASGSTAISVKNFYEYIKNYWQTGRAPGFWNHFLKRGVSGSRPTASAPPRVFRSSALNSLKKHSPSGGGNKYILTLYETSGLKQGDLSNTAWLMEFPDPVTKICWENYLCMSPADALKENVKEGDVLALLTEGGVEEAPVHIQPGQEDRILALAVGYGRTKAGAVGNNKGVNAYPLAYSKKKGISFSRAVVIRKTNRFVPLANVQGHHSMEGRDIVLETSLEKFKEDPSSGLPHHHKVPSLWSKHKYTGHKWGMVIDLNSCNGCGTCMIACQSENNIPTVGKKYVLEGREMHWMRIDRYYKGEPENPSTVHQPVVCMHCDNAPCETVCPVLATVHSDEGTNDMIYNRCVGTRYCSNNCPYKVRRFNWFDYTKKLGEKPLNLVLNPDVSIRNRGVMEKCTFCIQRIQEGKARAKKEDRNLEDGDIQTACQQSCPANAIVFGDLNDPKSKVSQAFKAKNSYALLDDMLNTKPAVKYHTKVRNGKLAHSKRKGAH